MKIDLVECKSSNIKAHGYDPASKTLAIKFGGSGDVYHYRGVEREIYEAMNSAESIGRFFASRIRDNYAGVRQVDEENRAARE